jgi:hypothetical protein
MKTYIDDEKVLLALKEIARNLVYFTDNPLPAYPQMNGGGFFTIGFDGEKKAEVFVFGVKEEELSKVVNFFNTYTYYGNNMFCETKHKVSVEKLLPYITLCKEKTYKSQITGRIVHFN